MLHPSRPKSGVTGHDEVPYASFSAALLPAQDGARPHRAVPQEDRQARQRHLLVGNRGVKQSREHLFKSCKKWKSQQAILWAEVRKKTKKRKGQVQISELFVEEKCSPAVLDFLRSTGVGRTVPREDGENEEDQDWGGGLDVFSALLSALFSALFFVLTVWRIVGRGENPVGPVSGGVRTRSVY